MLVIDAIGSTARSRRRTVAVNIEDLIALSQDAKKLMSTDVDRGREMLRRYLADGVIRCTVGEDGPFASCELGAHILLSDMQGRNRRIPGSGSSPRDSQVFAKSSGGAQRGLYDVYSLDFEADLAA